MYLVNTVGLTFLKTFYTRIALFVAILSLLLHLYVPTDTYRNVMIKKIHLSLNISNFIHGLQNKLFRHVNETRYAPLHKL